jgi:hypothetical protein
MMKEESNHYYHLQVLKLSHHSNFSRNWAIDLVVVDGTSSNDDVMIMKEESKHYFKLQRSQWSQHSNLSRN